MMRRMIIAIMIGAIFLGAGESANAIPAFARKYKTTCMTCHTSPTMLNEFGLRFQANGYQLPGAVDPTPIWDQDIVPVSFMLHAMWMWMKNSQSSDEMSMSMTNYNFVEPHGDLFSGGTLGPKVSYFSEFEVEPEGIKLETAFVIFNNILDLSRANFRIGKFFLDVPFPSRLSLSEDVKPLVYTYNPFEVGVSAEEEEEEEEAAGHEHAMIRGLSAFGTPTLHPLHGDEEAAEEAISGTLPTPVRFSAPQLGVSLFGFIPDILDGTRYEVALVNWHKNKRPDWFFRLNQTVYIHDAPFRVGVIYLNGRHQVDEIGFRSDFWRFGIDAELYDPWTKKVNLQFQYLKGNDDDVELEEGLQERDMNGGFIGANIFLLPEKLIAFGRFEWLNAEPQETRRWTSVLRYHLTPNVFIDLIYANTWSNFDIDEHHHDEEAEEGLHEGAFNLRPRDAMDMMTMSPLDEVTHQRNQMFMVMFMFIF